MTRAVSRDERHAETWERLAWYANGTLPAEERSGVEAHLAECDACSHELGFLEELGSQIRESEAMLLSPERSFRELTGRIDAIEAAEQGTLDWADIGRIVRARLMRPAWRPALAALALLLVVLLSWSALSVSRPSFRTLSSAETPIEGSAPIVRLVFDDVATAEEIQALLNGSGAEIVAGPSEYGVYTVRLDPSAQPRHLDATLSALRRHPAVRFAELIRAADGGR